MEKLNIWFDEEGDFLEIRMGEKKGFSEKLEMISGRGWMKMEISLELLF